MKTGRILRKILAGVLAMRLLLPLAVPGWAEETETEESGTTVEETEPQETAAQTGATSERETQPQEPTQESIPPTETEAGQNETIQPKETNPRETQPETSAYHVREEARGIVTIAEAKSLSSGTEDVQIRGTVVYVGTYQLVLQDDSGGIRVSGISEATLGDVLLVTGNRSGGFYATGWEKIGAAELPAREMTLAGAPEDIRIHITDGVLTAGSLVQGETTIRIKGDLPNDTTGETTVEAYGVIMDGVFYADTVRITGGGTSSVDAAEPEDGYRFYFGQLHAHSNLSSGEDDAEALFTYAKEEGLDFFAVTDHSNSFDNAQDGKLTKDGSTISTKWQQGREAAEEASGENFVGLYGFEMSWPSGYHMGHISTFGTPGWQSWNQKGFDTLEAYYQVLETVPAAVSQFNHPSAYEGEFENFAHYREEYDAGMYLLEIDSGSENCDTYYQKALNKGWHVAPTLSQNLHAIEDGIGAGRTVVLAKELTEQGLFAAMREYRVYASEDADLEIEYRLNGALMGSRLEDCEEAILTVNLVDPTDATDEGTGKVEVIVDGGEVAAEGTIDGGTNQLTFHIPGAYRYYYLRITQPDGDMAITAPVWITRPVAVEIQTFACDTPQPIQNEEASFRLILQNEEITDVTVEEIKIMEADSDGEVFHTVSPKERLKKGESYENSFSVKMPLKCRESGKLELRAEVCVTVNGMMEAMEKSLTVDVASRSNKTQTIADSTVAELRTSERFGRQYRIQGYVTAGTSNLSTTFPDTIYLQDDTGGIEIKPFSEMGIAIGTPMDITGTLTMENGNFVLVPVSYEMLEEDYYRYTPKTLSNETATDYDTLGGSLVQVEGKVVSLEYTADKKGISKIQIKDVVGELATVMVEEGICSGSTGKNELAGQVKVGRTVRAIGVLHRIQTGEAVIRVRNCDEVVYVAPKADPTNPKTGDARLWHP